MRKIFLSSLSLLAFSASIILFQISCKKDAKADTTTTSTSVSQQNKILFTQIAGNTTTLWTANYDGSNPQIVNIVPPDGLSVLAIHAHISPDGKTIFVPLYIPTSGVTSIYACNTDGSNLHKVIANATSGTGDGADLNEVY